MNIAAKFEENPSIDIGFIERTRLWRRTDGRTDRQTDATKRIHYSPTHFVIILWWGDKKGIGDMKWKVLRTDRRTGTVDKTDIARGIICTHFVENHLMLLHAKYQSSM